MKTLSERLLAVAAELERTVDGLAAVKVTYGADLDVGVKESITQAMGLCNGALGSLDVKIGRAVRHDARTGHEARS